jgi:hypothetical protein
METFLNSTFKMYIIKQNSENVQHACSIIISTLPNGKWCKGYSHINLEVDELLNTSIYIKNVVPYIA